MNKILLSIVFPTFEREATIGCAIKSMLSNISTDIQEYVELLIIDNFSQDNTKQIVTSLINSNKQIENFHLISNNINLGYDLNHYKAYTYAQGDFIWFCSDRYIYNINVKTIIEIIKGCANLSVITFSDLLRKEKSIIKNPFDIDTVEKMYETLNFAQFNGSIEEYNLTPCYTITNSNLTKVGINSLRNISFTVNVSDCIVKIYREQNWLARLKLYDGTYMLVIAALLKSFSDLTQKCTIINLPFYTKSFYRINSKGGRHLNSKVAFGNLMLQDDFAFIGTKEEILLHHLKILINIVLINISNSKKDFNYLKIKDIFALCDSFNYKLPFLLKIWITLFKVKYLPYFMVKPLIFINKVVFKTHEIYRAYKK